MSSAVCGRTGSFASDLRAANPSMILEFHVHGLEPRPLNYRYSVDLRSWMSVEFVGVLS
jgi:hypothetical protein